MDNNNFILLVGRSGSGKTTVVNYFCNMYNAKQIQSYTTRPKREEGETGHTFVNKEQFDKLTDMVGYTMFDGNEYCATSEQVNNCDIYVIDPSGVDYFRNHYKGNKNVICVYLNCPTITCLKSLIKRDGLIKGIKRFRHDNKAFKGVPDKDYFLLNYRTFSWCNLNYTASILKFLLEGTIK